jgi:hypothetical protein
MEFDLYLTCTQKYGGCYGISCYNGIVFGQHIDIPDVVDHVLVALAVCAWRAL